MLAELSAMCLGVSCMRALAPLQACLRALTLHVHVIQSLLCQHLCSTSLDTSEGGSLAYPYRNTHYSKKSSSTVALVSPSQSLGLVIEFQSTMY